MRQPALATRLRDVVDTVFDGNVLAAAMALGLPVSTLHRILERKVAGPRLDTLYRIAEGLGVSAGWLLGEVSDDQEFGGVPRWRHLIVAHNRRRQRKARAELSTSKPSTARGKRLATAYRGLDWLTDPSTSPIPHLDLLIEGSARGNRLESRLLRQLAELETALLEAAVVRLKELEDDEGNFG
jgi:transcriptional regulator with XRE-family HTH domain